MLKITDILFIFYAFLAALMAIARKVIVFDFEDLTPQYILATAAVVLALGITYWLVSRKREG